MDIELYLELEERLIGLTSRIIRMETALIHLAETMNGGTMNDSDEKAVHYAVPWPSLCDECGHALSKDAIERVDLDCLVCYCPHRHSLAIAFTGDIEGRRGIIRWDVESPVTYSEAVETMNKMAPHARIMQNLDKPHLQ